MRTVKICAALALFVALGVHTANVDIGPVVTAPLAAGRPLDSVYDAQGNLYVSDRDGSRILKYPAGETPTGSNAAELISGLGQYLSGMTINSVGELVFGEQGAGKLRKVNLQTLVISTIAGTGAQFDDSVVAPIATTQLPMPNGVTQHPGTLDYYVASHISVVFRLTTTERTTFAGLAWNEGTTGGVGAAARFDQPMNLDIRPSDGNIYVADSNQCLIRLITTPGAVVSTIAGSSYGFQDGVGSAAKFGVPYDIALLSGGLTAFVADRDAKRVRRLDLTTFAVDTVAGNGGNTWTANALSTQASLGPYVFGLGLNPDNTKLAVTGENTIALVTITPPCSCPLSLTADYTTLHVPVATTEATSAITLNEATWEVTFTVSNVVSITNGHVIAGSVNPKETAAEAFTPLVSSFANVWNPPSDCTVGTVDTPAASLGITLGYDAANCKKSYTVKWSLIDTTKQNSHCQLVDAGGNIKVSCGLVLTSVRAYDATAPTAFLSHPTTFTSEMTLPKTIVDQHASQLHAAMAKCSVRNSPSHQVECRIPGLWTFTPSISISQAPALWIVPSSCVSSQAGGATFLTCNLNSSAPISTVTTASAVISVTVSGTSPAEVMSFNVEYTVPRLLTTSASASLEHFVTNIAMADGKFYYGTADTASLQIDVVDTSRLAITSLEFFNNATPVQTYNLRAHPQFQLVESTSSTRFTIQFAPSAILQDSAFYKNGPHGVRVTFSFTSARRAESSDENVVMVNGMQVDVPPAQAQPNASKDSDNTVLPWAIGGGVGVLAVGLIGAAAVVRARRTAKVSAPPVECDTPAPITGEMQCVADLDHAAVDIENATTE